ncbi:MAG: hypothetical protein HKN43_15540 [Rhodothermales bacterium]|nr:hypothetical protein [Rhodothermales bacterium]
MTVTSVEYKHNVRGGVDAEGTTSYVDVWYVETDDKNDLSNTVRGPQAVALGLPDYKDPWAPPGTNDSNVYALCTVRDAELLSPEESRLIWKVTLTFTTEGQSRDSSGGGGSGTGNEEGVQDPLDERWRYSGSYVLTTERTSNDKDGDPIQNSSEESVHVDRPSGYDSLVMTGNTALIDLPVRTAARAKCNETPMWGLMARQVYLARWDWSIKYRGLTAYVAHRLEWWLKDGTELWNTEFLDVGTRYLVDNTAKLPKDRYKYASISDLQSKVFLDGAGGPLDKTVNPGGMVINVKVIKEYDFLTNMTFLENPLTGPFS